MQPSYKSINCSPMNVTEENWQRFLTTLLPDRPGFNIENDIIFIQQIAGQFLGLPLDEDEYYDRLFDLVQEEQYHLELISEDALNKNIDNLQFQAIQKVINLLYEQNLSINRLTAFLDGEHLIVRHEIPAMNRIIREAMMDVLHLFSETEEHGLKNTDFRRVLVDLVKWSFNHLDPSLKISSPQTSLPKFLWYGDYKKSHQYFVIFLLKIGCDVLLFHPQGESMLSGLYDKNIFTHNYEKSGQDRPFPKEKSMRKATVAYRASREIETILHQEGSGLYKPWQLREYQPTSITLKTTYDELFILIKEMAMIRPDFEVKNGQVIIPSIFAKIQGVTKDRKEYWQRLHSMAGWEHSMLIRHFPFTVSTSNDFRFHYRDALGLDGLLDIEKMMSSHYWKYVHLPVGLQKAIGQSIRKLCENPLLKKVHGENDEELRIFLFSQAMQTSNSIIQLMQKFDYSQQIPKIILYNNGISGVLARSDAALLLLLNKFGFDIVLYNPAGHNDIENFVDKSLYDTHWLEDIVFEQPYKEVSFAKKGFFQGLIKNLRGD